MDTRGESSRARAPHALLAPTHLATLAIAAGVGLFDLSRLMGTSLSQIDKTYGHKLPDSIDRARTAIDAFLAASEVQEGAQER